jgi:hypothetical protein
VFGDDPFGPEVAEKVGAEEEEECVVGDTGLR